MSFSMKELTPERLLGRELNDVERKNSPRTLFVSGSMEIPLHVPRCAIVGTRLPSPEGRLIARELAQFLSEHGITVISGLARGIDSEAHKGSIESGGRTIAVIGTPLDKFYPKENIELQKELMKNHLVVSQFRIGQPIYPGNFIQRNRTMALLCDASVIVEAGDSSGTLSQGWEALRLGRPLFLWKSITENSNLKWPAEMLKYGAIQLDDFSMVLEELPSNGSGFEVPEL